MEVCHKLALIRIAPIGAIVLTSSVVVKQTSSVLNANLAQICSKLTASVGPKQLSDSALVHVKGST